MNVALFDVGATDRLLLQRGNLSLERCRVVASDGLDRMVPTAPSTSSNLWVRLRQNAAALFAARTDPFSARPRGFWYGLGSAWLEGAVARLRTTKPHEADEASLRLWRLDVDPGRLLRLATEEDVLAIARVLGGPSGRIEWRRLTATHDGVELGVFDAEWAQAHCPTWLPAWGAPRGCVWRACAIRGASEVTDGEARS